MRPDISCTRCGSSNASHLRYCATCGTTLPKKEAPTHPEGVQPANSVARAAGSQAATAQLGNDPNKRILPGHLVNADQVAAQHCGSCGVELVAGAAFCQGCGSSVKKAATPAPTGARGAPPAKLVVIAQDGTPGREYPLTAGRVDIGREQGEVLLNGDPYACPRHARILWKNQLFWVMDLGSVNGVFARLTSPERLAHGDIVLIGLEVFRFEIVNTLEANREPAVERGTRLFGSPALPRYARLVQRTVEGIGSNVFYLSKSQVSIGRETGDFVFGDDAFMSRQHATFTRQQDGSFLLTDLGSSNGTFIAIRDERPLPDGGHVRIGQHLFRLKIEGQSVG